MAYEFWLTDEKNNIKLLLPITPREYSNDYGNDIEVINATAKGDIHIAGHRRLMHIPLTGFFTVKEYYFANKPSYSVSSCMDYVNLIKMWVDTKAIIRLIVTNNSITNINALFYVESITYSEDNTSNGDINYSISLKEYRAMELSTSKIAPKSMANNKTRTQGSTQKKSKTYTVVSGDSLNKIARKTYGDGSQWSKIYNANKSIIGKNPNLISIGQVYVIP